MRIIAGTLGGRSLHEPHGHRTHPMSEKIRGALFNALGDIEGLTFLDAFAGSGALSFESISRGAGGVTAIDIDKKAVQAMKQSAKELGVEGKIKVTRANVSSWSDNNQDEHFDIVFAAPPYDDLQEELVRKLTKHTKVGGLYVLDLPGDRQPLALSGLELITAKLYGDAQLAFYRKKE